VEAGVDRSLSFKHIPQTWELGDSHTLVDRGTLQVAINQQCRLAQITGKDIRKIGRHDRFPFTLYRAGDDRHLATCPRLQERQPCSGHAKLFGNTR
jgi:hypothetical protein